MASLDDRRDSDGWRRWRFELAAYGKYVELSFEDVVIRSAKEIEKDALARAGDEGERNAGGGNGA